MSNHILYYNKSTTYAQTIKRCISNKNFSNFHYKHFKLNSITLITLLFTGLFMTLPTKKTSAQNGVATRDEIQLMEILKKAVDTKLINLSFKDSVEIFIKQELRQKKTLLDSKTLTPSSRANRLSINPNSSPYLYQQQLKQELIKMDRFSTGVDGYYRKMIDMGYFNNDWAATKEQREAMDRLLTDIRQHLNGAETGNSPEFLRKMNKSNNGFVRIIGALLTIMNNGANRTYRPQTLPPQLR
jgi:hypothetical protein